MVVKVISSETEFDQEIAGDALTVVDFFAEWCGPCKVIGPILSDMSEEAEMKAAGIKFLKVDVDQQAKLAARCEVSAMPTFHFYKKSAKVDMLVGANPEKLRALVLKHK
mmetsp:Transcript_11057/g.26704  ORF Transcript_11057/g.26704 Transcript_11057/m.26704 type:complete len:109 (-) Transcript_11057:168-494(-)